MTSGFGSARVVAIAAVSVLGLAACGGSSSGDDAPAGTSGEAGVVLESAPPVESAVVDSTTSSTTEVIETTTVPTPEPAATPPPESAPTTPPLESTTTAPVPDSTPAPTEPPESVSTGVPVGYRPIIDESGELRANVPAAWIEIDGALDGAIRQLSAASDLAGFLGGYAQPGMVLLTGEAATPDAWMDGLATTLGSAESDGCTVSETSDYDDGVYTGTEHLLSCGTTASVAHLIGGRNAEGDLFFLLALVRPTDDRDVRDQIVQSFFID